MGVAVSVFEQVIQTGSTVGELMRVYVQGDTIKLELDSADRLGLMLFRLDPEEAVRVAKALTRAAKHVKETGR